MHSFGSRLALVAAVGAVGRLVRLAAVKWDQQLLFNDSLYYSAQARQLVEGRFFRDIFVDRPAAEHGPLTSVVLAPFSWAADPVPWQRLGTVVLGVATIVLIGFLGRRVAGPTVGLVAAAVAAVYPNLWVNDGLVMSESLTALLVTAALWALLVLDEALDGPGREWVRPAVGFGALVGLAALTRSELALFGPLAAIPLLWRTDRVRRGLAALAVVGAVALAVVAPWTAYNLTRFERPVLLTTNDGTTLIGAYCTETFEGPHLAGWWIGCVWDHPTYDPTLDPSVLSARQRAAALEFVGDHLGQVPEMMVRRVARTFDLTAIDQLVDHDTGEEHERWAVHAGIAAFWVLAPLAAVGALRVGSRVRRVLVLPLVTTVLVSALFYGAHRFRTPLEPVIVVLAAVTLVDLARELRRARR